MNFICGLGCLPWLYIYRQKYNKNNKFFNNIPLFIFLNGIFFHFIFTNNIYIKNYDTACNIIFIAYCNYYTKYKLITSFSTFISILSFYKNITYDNDIIHILFVNWILIYPYLLIKYT